LYEADHKFKLAENDYASAIYYDPENAGFYMKRAEFYWRNQRINEANEDLKVYWHIKNLEKNNKMSKIK